MRLRPQHLSQMIKTLLSRFPSWVNPSKRGVAANVADDGEEGLPLMLWRKARLRQHRESGFHPHQFVRTHQAVPHGRGLQEPRMVKINGQTSMRPFF